MSQIHVKRHIAKTVSYRLLGTLQTVGFGYLLTGSMSISATLGVVELVFKPIMYFLHERLWYRWISFGVIKE